MKVVLLSAHVFLPFVKEDQETIRREAYTFFLHRMCCFMEHQRGGGRFTCPSTYSSILLLQAMHFFYHRGMSNEIQNDFLELWRPAS